MPTNSASERRWWRVWRDELDKLVELSAPRTPMQPLHNSARSSPPRSVLSCSSSRSVRTNVTLHRLFSIYCTGNIPTPSSSQVHNKAITATSLPIVRNEGCLCSRRCGPCSRSARLLSWPARLRCKFTEYLPRSSLLSQNRITI